MPKRKPRQMTLPLDDEPPPRGHNQPPLPSPGERLAEMAARVNRLLDDKETVETELGTVKRALLQMQRETIPELCKELGGLTSVALAGLEIAVKSDVDVSIPAKNKDAAHAWLVENGHGGLLTLEVVIPFGRDAEKEAVALLQRLTEDHPQAALTTKLHAATLKSWAKERLKAGEELPEELFKITPYDWADIKKSKTGD